MAPEISFSSWKGSAGKTASKAAREKAPWPMSRPARVSSLR